MTSPVFLAHREVYHFCMKKGRRKPQASLPAIMTVIRLLRCASESASYQFAYRYASGHSTRHCNQVYSCAHTDRKTICRKPLCFLHTSSVIMVSLLASSCQTESPPTIPFTYIYVIKQLKHNTAIKRFWKYNERNQLFLTCTRSANKIVN